MCKIGQQMRQLREKRKIVVASIICAIDASLIYIVENSLKISWAGALRLGPPGCGRLARKSKEGRYPQHSDRDFFYALSFILRNRD